MAKRPNFSRFRDPQTDAEWDALAAFKGVESGAALKEQTRIADEIISQIFDEESAVEGVMAFIQWVKKKCSLIPN